MAVNQLWSEFKAEARFGYEFYSKDVDWASLEQHRGWKRKLYAARALAWALLRKLSPARRIFLLATLAFVVLDFLGSRGDSGIIIATAALVLLVVADVAGKSIPAALLMAMIQASLRTLAASPVALAELYLASRILRYISAGHNPPVLRRASGAIERLEAGGLPLGVMAAARYEQGEAVLTAGDLLVVFTDGVIEAENERQEEYGEPRLLELVKAMPPGTAAGALRTVLAAVDGYVGATRQHDDITALVMLMR